MNLKGKRTILIALALEVFGVLEAFDFTSIMGSETAGFVVMGIAVVMGYLRKITTTPVGFTTNPDPDGDTPDTKP